jgi:predicted MPP superfamily phosphohydrolase
MLALCAFGIERIADFMKPSEGILPKALRIILIIFILGVLLLLVIAAFWRGLVVRTYQVTSEKITGEIRLVVVSDLHGAEYGSEQKDILHLIAGRNPDVILLAGDIIDDVFPAQPSLSFIKGAVEIAPCYYVTGSHDLWYSGYPEARQMMLDSGVIVLEGSTVPLRVKGQEISISGIDDPTMGTTREDKEAYRNALHRAFSGISDERFNILLAHRPDYMDDYARYNFDLVVSGHTHGGQVRIPFLINGLFAPDQGWFPRYAGGLYQDKGIPLMISRGVSYYPKLPRIFNPPEVVLIRLMAE